MQGTGTIGAIALIILFLFISFIVFIVKLSLDLRAHSKHKTYPTESEPVKQKSPPNKPAPNKEIMYLVEKPQPKNTKKEKEYSLVSPKNIYIIDTDKIKK